MMFPTSQLTLFLEEALTDFKKGLESLGVYL